jgi:hypothetical protein
VNDRAIDDRLRNTAARQSTPSASGSITSPRARWRAFVVSLAVFWVGGALSVVEGIDHLTAPEQLIEPRWAFAVL